MKVPNKNMEEFIDHEDTKIHKAGVKIERFFSQFKSLEIVNGPTIYDSHFKIFKLQNKNNKNKYIEIAPVCTGRGLNLFIIEIDEKKRKRKELSLKEVMKRILKAEGE